MDDENIAHHAQGVLRGAQFGFGVELPSDGDFADGEAEAAGEVEQFDVERPAGQGLQAKDLFGGRGGEAFESALGVVQAGQDQGADGEVDGAPAEVAVDRLVVAPRAAGFARGDGDVCVCESRREEMVELVNGHGQVGVAHEAVLAFGIQHAAADGETFAALALAQDAQAGMPARIIFGDFEGAIPAPVFHHQHFG